MSTELKQQKLDDSGRRAETEAEKFERQSRGQDALYLFSPPTHARYHTGLAEIAALEAVDLTARIAGRERWEAKLAADALLHEKMAQALPKEQREALSLHWFDEMTVAHIAAYQRVSVQGVYKRLKLGCAKLLEALPDFRTLYPYGLFVEEADDTQAVWIEHHLRDNRRDVSADDERDESGWSPTHRRWTEAPRESMPKPKPLTPVQQRAADRAEGDFRFRRRLMNNELPTEGDESTLRRLLKESEARFRAAANAYLARIAPKPKKVLKPIPQYRGTETI
jgi:hypothetical protein